MSRMRQIGNFGEFRYWSTRHDTFGDYAELDTLWQFLRIWESRYDGFGKYVEKDITPGEFLELDIMTLCEKYVELNKTILENNYAESVMAIL